MTALAAMFSKDFKALAIDAIIIRDGINVPGDKIVILSKELFATVVGSEIVLWAISFLSTWAENKNSHFSLDAEEDVETLSKTVSILHYMYSKKSPNVHLDCTTVVLVSRDYIKILDFKVYGKSDLQILKTAMLKEGQVYCNYGGKQSTQSMTLPNDPHDIKQLLAKEINAAEVSAKNTEYKLPYDINNTFSFVLLPNDSSKLAIEQGPFTLFSEFLCAQTGLSHEEFLKEYPDPNWSPF